MARSPRDNRGQREESELIEKLVGINRVAKVVKGGRRFGFAAIMVVGDGKGRVGYGAGKAREVPEEIRKATENARKAMVRIPLREGRTLHHDVKGRHGAGRVVLRSAPAGTGISFIRKDLTGHPVIQARSENVVDTNLCTSIGNNGSKISTIEHLMAAFFGLGIDNARVELDGPEVPIMDGSSAPFIFLLKSVGIKEQRNLKRFVVIKKPFEIQEGNRSVAVHPSKELKITYTIDFHHPLLKIRPWISVFPAKISSKR